VAAATNAPMEQPPRTRTVKGTATWRNPPLPIPGCRRLNHGSNGLLKGLCATVRERSLKKHADKIGAIVITAEVAHEGIEQAKDYMAEAMKTGNLKDMIANRPAKLVPSFAMLNVEFSMLNDGSAPKRILPIHSS